jgi:lysophospholipase L1-like esterase
LKNMATPRLPIPGADNGQWGDILNDFLAQAHNGDGSLKPSAVTAAGGNTVADGSITSTKLADQAVTNAKLDTATQTALSRASTSVQSINTKTPDGSGAITLAAGDIGAVASVTAADSSVVVGGSASAPTVKVGNLSTTYTPLSADGRSALNLTDYQKLMPWFAALTNRKGRRADVVIMGDSFIEGYPVTSYGLSVSANLASVLRARHPVSGVTGGRGFIGIPSTFMATNDPGGWPLALTGGAYDDTFYGFGAKHRVWYASATGAKAVLTLASPITSFDINQMINTAGHTTTGYYKIDGGTAVPFSTYATSNASAVTHIASPASTSIEIGWNATGYLFLEGITEYNGDENAGITVHNCGYSGYTTTNWLVKSTVWPTSMKLLNPDLIVITLGTNDSATTVGNMGSASFGTNLTSLIAALRTASITCPVVISMAWDTPLAKVEPWVNYVNAAKAVAAADATVLCVDNSARMPAAGSAQGTALGLYHTDQAHGNANGNAYMYLAETLYAAVAPR